MERSCFSSSDQRLSDAGGVDSRARQAPPPLPLGRQPSRRLLLAATLAHFAAHGAGMTNLLWCQPGTKVIEIQDKRMIHKKVYPLLSHNLNLQHKLYLADVEEIPRENGKKLEGVKRFSDMINFKINIPEIMEHLE